MRDRIDQRAAWALVRAQHGAIASAQLYAFGLTSQGDQAPTGHRAALSPSSRGLCRWATGPDAARAVDGGGARVRVRRGAESPDRSGALGDAKAERRSTEVSVPAPAETSRASWSIGALDLTDEDVTARHGIPVTTPAATLIDLAAGVTRRQLEAAMNEADKHDLIAPSMLQSVLDRAPRRPGAGRMRDAPRRMDLHPHRLRARAPLPTDRPPAGLPTPQTRPRVNGFKVDFFFQSLGLVVETDGGRFHRTAAQQTRDRIRDQRHARRRATPAPLHPSPDRAHAPPRRGHPQSRRSPPQRKLRPPERRRKAPRKAAKALTSTATPAARGTGCGTPASRSSAIVATAHAPASTSVCER